MTVDAYSRSLWNVPRTPGRFLLWLLRRQAGVMVAFSAWGLVWLIPATVDPYLLGRAIDAGVVHSDPIGALLWAGLMAATVLVATVGLVGQHIYEVKAWLVALFGVQKLTVRKAAQLGHVQARRVSSGEALSVSASDSNTFGEVTNVTARAVIGVVMYAIVAGIVLSTSARLGAAVLIATPLALLLASPLMIPLERASAQERSRQAELTDMTTDIVAGLRILRGIGGEDTFARRFNRLSRRLQRIGITAGTWEGALHAAGVLMAGLLLAMLSWVGALELLSGRLTIGQMISFFGYAVLLMWPLSAFFEFARVWVSGLVAARRTLEYLSLTPPRTDVGEPLAYPAGAHLVDERSGIVIRPGCFTGIVCEDGETAARLADRLGYFLPPADPPPSLDEDELRGSDARRRRAERDARLQAQLREERAELSGSWGVTADGIDFSRIAVDALRREIVVMDTGTQLFSGTLQQAIDPWGRSTRTQAEDALRAAAAEDVLVGLPEGWQGFIDERGRGLSGGQRQRVALARALVADPQVLVLVEPTSAVDAHTEARIAHRLPEARAGRSTVVVTASPLLLRAADQVQFVVGGVLTDSGSHSDLMVRNHDYRSVVARGMGEDETP